MRLCSALSTSQQRSYPAWISRGVVTPGWVMHTSKDRSFSPTLMTLCIISNASRCLAVVWFQSQSSQILRGIWFLWWGGNERDGGGWCIKVKGQRSLSSSPLSWRYVQESAIQPLSKQCVDSRKLRGLRPGLNLAVMDVFLFSDKTAGFCLSGKSLRISIAVPSPSLVFVLT